MRSPFHLLLCLALALGIVGCESPRTGQSSLLAPGQLSPFDDIEMAVDLEYGFSEKKPIEVGGFTSVGHQYQYEYMSNLRGPDGERLSMHRVGSCCHFKTKNGMMGIGLLDV